MPRIPKTLPAQLRQYYKTAPRPASAYGDDVFNFAADRLGRRNRAMLNGTIPTPAVGGK